MGATFRSVVATDPSESLSWTATMPAGVTDGDLVLILIITNSPHTLNSGGEWTTSAGWAQIGSTASSATDHSTSLIYKVASSFGATVTLTNLFDTTTEYGRAVAAAYYSQASVSPINTSAQADAGSTDTVSGPSVTPTVDNCLIIQFVGADPSSSMTGTPDGSPVATERYDGGDAGNNAYGYIQEYQQTTAAALALDVVFSTSDRFTSHQVALAPAAVGGDPEGSLIGGKLIRGGLLTHGVLVRG